MISEVKNVGHNVLRIVVSQVKVSHSPGQFVMVQSFGLDYFTGGPLHLTITSPMQTDAKAFTLHFLIDEETKHFEHNWRKVFLEADITVPCGNCEPVFQDTVVLLIAETVPGDYSAAIPLVSLLKTYIAVKGHGLAKEMFIYLLVEHAPMYEWFIACFEEPYLTRKLPPNVHFTVHLLGLKKENLSQGSALENSFTWTTSLWPTFKETPTPSADSYVCLGFVGSPFDWQRAIASFRNLRPSHSLQHYRLCMDIFGFRAPPQFRTRLPDPLPDAPSYWWPMDWLFRETDPCNLGFFRMAFGAAAFITQVWAIFNGQFYNTYIDTEIQLPYDYLEWVPVLKPRIWLYYHAWVVAASALGICFACFFRLSCFIFLVSYTWLWLLDSSAYHDHHYLTSLLALCLLFTNAGNFLALTGRSASVKPVPYWNLFILKFVVSISYFYSGLAKLDYDWLRGYPMAIWITYNMDETLKYAIALVSSWLILALEILAPTLLWASLTRPPAILVSHAYHIICSLVLYPTPCPFLLHTPQILFLETHTVRHILLSLLTRFGAYLHPLRFPFRVVRALHRRLPFYVDENISARFVLETARREEAEELEKFKKAQEEAKEAAAKEKEKADQEKAKAQAQKAEENADSGSPKARKGGLRRRKGKKDVPDNRHATIVENNTDKSDVATSSSNSKEVEEKKKNVAVPPKRKPVEFPASAQPNRAMRLLVVLGLVFFMAWQILMPLRPLYFEHVASNLHKDLPGTLGTSWTEHGQKFSWRGLLDSKKCSGQYTIKTGLPYNEATLQNPCNRHIHPFNLSQAQCAGVLQSPSMIRNHARLLKTFYQKKWRRYDVLVYADLRCSLNGANTQQYTFRRMDISSVPSPSFSNWTRPEPFVGPQQWYAGGKSFQP